MLPRTVLDSVTTRDGRRLVLYQRGDDFVIQVDHEELMSSRSHGSEEGLAHLGLRALGPRPSPRILVGGLGLGFTLRAVLDRVGPRTEATVVVAELFPAVVAWNRTWLGHLASHPLDDPRVQVLEKDLADCLGDARSTGKPYDLILLDVDNGPEAFTVSSNRHLYGPRGIGYLRQALVPGGIVAVWSATPAPQFVKQLEKGGFGVQTHHVAARSGSKRHRHVVMVAQRLE
jgi:spermidine synthase